MDEITPRMNFCVWEAWNDKMLKLDNLKKRIFNGKQILFVCNGGGSKLPIPVAYAI